MILKEAIGRCHIRSAIYRELKPNIKYWKNNPIDIVNRIPEEDRNVDDWEEFDPRDQYDCSLF